MKSWRHDKQKTAERGYGGRWQKERAAYLVLHPLCVMCEPRRVVLATVVDHQVPHRGDQALFWDWSNWQSLCQTHHNRDKQAIEKGGKVRAEIGTDGWPKDA